MKPTILKWSSFLSVAALLAFGGQSLAQGPAADYGDAPDPTFPSLFASSGPRHLGLTDCYVGWTSTPEPNALVPDMDLDDGMPLIYADLNSGIWTGWVYVPITLSTTADPLLPRYINILFDGNESGTWCDVAGEWIVRNFRLPNYTFVHQAGQTVWYCIGGFDWVTDYSGQHWVRITLSDAPVTANVPSGWNGSRGPAFAVGETEDWLLTWYYSPYPPTPPDPPTPVPPPPFDPLDPDPPEPVPPCNKTASVEQVPPPVHIGHSGNFTVRIKNTSSSHPIHIVEGPFLTDKNGDPVDIGWFSRESTVLQPGQKIDSPWWWEFQNHGENKAWGNVDVVVDPQGQYVVVANVGNYLGPTSQQPNAIGLVEVGVPAVRGVALVVLVAALVAVAVMFIVRRGRVAQRTDS